MSSRRPDRAREFAGQFRAARAHDTLEQLVRDDEVDVIYVATPHHHHRQHAVACLEAGKAVLCEKPFALNAAETGQIVEQARRSRRFCMEAMWMRFHPLILKVRSMVQSGEIGTVRLLTADFGYSTPDDARGRFFDLGSAEAHCSIAGSTRSPWLISCSGLPPRLPAAPSIGETGVDEQDALVFTYSGGAIAMLAASLRSRLRNEAVIVGTRGQIRIHEPFYAPHRISIRRFSESVAPASSDAITPDGWKTRLKRHPLIRRIFDTLGRPLLDNLRGVSHEVHYAVGQGYQFEAAEVMHGSVRGNRKAPSCHWRNRSRLPGRPTTCGEPGSCAIRARSNDRVLTSIADLSRRQHPPCPAHAEKQACQGPPLPCRAPLNWSRRDHPPETGLLKSQAGPWTESFDRCVFAGTAFHNSKRAPSLRKMGKGPHRWRENQKLVSIDSLDTRANPGAYRPAHRAVETIPCADPALRLFPARSDLHIPLDFGQSITQEMGPQGHAGGEIVIRGQHQFLDRPNGILLAGRDARLHVVRMAKRPPLSFRFEPASVAFCLAEKVVPGVCLLGHRQGAA